MKPKTTRQWICIPAREVETGPNQRVQVAPFLARHLAVSVDEFSEFVMATGYVTVAHRRGGGTFDDNPCINELSKRARSKANALYVAPMDAVEYCRWRGTRLPSFAEQVAMMNVVDGLWSFDMSPRPWFCDERWGVYADVWKHPAWVKRWCSEIVPINAGDGFILIDLGYYTLKNSPWRHTEPIGFDTFGSHLTFSEIIDVDALPRGDAVVERLSHRPDLQ